jgi:hypothetical protein
MRDELPLSQYGLSISVYLISIMIAIGGVVLGLGYALNEKKMKEFGKKELLESIINGVIVGSIFVLFTNNGIVTTAINQATLANGTVMKCSGFMANNTAICLAYNYLASPVPYTYKGVERYSVLSTATTTITDLLLLNGILGMIAGVKIDLGIVTFSFSYVISPIINELQYIVKLLGTVDIVAVVQASILDFVAVCVLTVLLPTGIILRTFYPTRKLGGFIMALSIGLYVVLPMSYVLDVNITNSYPTYINQTSISSISASATSLKDSVFGAEAQYNATSNSTNSRGILQSINSGVSFITNGITGIINSLLNSLAYLIVYSFILPIFSLIITGISVRELSVMLGSEAFFGRFNIL